MAESEEEVKNLLMKVKEESEKAGLKLNIKKKKKFISFGLIISWQIEREKVKVVIDFIFFVSTITVDSDVSHEIKSCLLFERNAMTNLDRAFKIRDITLLTKVCMVKAMDFQ